MATIYKLLFLTFLLTIFTACGPEPITEDMVHDEPANEVEAEVKAMEEAPLNIPSVSEEVVDEKESPIEMAEPEPEPEPLVSEPEIIEDVETETTAENNATQPEPSPVEVVPEDTNTTADETIVTEEANATMPEKEPVVETPPFEPYVEQIGVLKIRIEENAIRLMMKDPIIKYFALTAPDRIVIDFKDVRYLEPMIKEIDAPLISQIATATHDDYNRVVIYLKVPKQFTISKNRGDWLIDLK